MEKKLCFSHKILYILSSNIVGQSSILMNLLIIIFTLKEFIGSHLMKERMKKAFRSKVNYGKKYKVKIIEVDQNMRRDVVMKSWNFSFKKKKKMKYQNPIILDVD